MDDIPLRHMTTHELLVRKAKLEHVLEILQDYDYTEVCLEIGEITYLLDKQKRDLHG